MFTLGIETSCDETSCAILKNGDKILSNIISSSLFRHKPFGGVVPEIASRHSLEQIDTVFQEALAEARIKSSQIDLIAVTQGPGLIGSLFVGVAFAKALAYQLGVPLVGVNHLEAHLSANFIGAKAPHEYAGLLISGGHTSLSYHKNGRAEILGETVDDAVGEAFDKVAKILGLGYPGGPIIDKLAREGNPRAFRFTKPKQDNPFDFSFSGIKTAVLYETQQRGHSRARQKSRRSPSGRVSPSLWRKSGNPLDPPVKPGDDKSSFIRDMAASFQQAAVSWLIEKSLAVAHFKKVHDLVVGGGVSANSQLRKDLAEEGIKQGIRVWFPQRVLSLDNAAMIARRGVEIYRQGKRGSFTMTGIPNLEMT